MAEPEDLPAGYVGRVVMYDDETRLEIDAGHTLATGDLFMAYRGNGPREGDLMAVATIVAAAVTKRVSEELRVGEQVERRRKAAEAEASPA
jgi:hypothetical protein